MKKILVCFDGTGNEPEDADPELDDEGLLEDENISNVLKLHLRAGGRFDAAVEAFGQLSLYFAGPGTRGGVLRRAVESALAPASLAKIQSEALFSLRETYQSGDEVSVFGFSRGAAIARRFVSHLQTLGLADDEKGAEPGQRIPVRFVGVWDTVLSEGAAQKDSEIRSPAELGETNGIGPDVGRVVHLVSIDDPRKVFTPTLFAPDDRVSEVWLAGVHSDVGGGYRKAGLSDIALEFMLERATAEAGLTFAAPGDIDPGSATGGRVNQDDLKSHPDPNADDHTQNFDKFVKDFIDALGSRNVMCLEGGVPVLHGSVVERGKMQHYRPGNLKNLRHTIWDRLGIEHQSFWSHFSGS